MVDIEKRTRELRVILAEIERDIETLQANISKLRDDMDGVNTETDLAAFDEAHDNVAPTPRRQHSHAWS